MRKCEKCGAEFENEEFFCPECGAKIDVEEAAEAADVAEAAELPVTDEELEAEAMSYTEELEVAERVPMDPKKKKSLIISAVSVFAVILVLFAFYCFGSMGFLSKIGIVNAFRYKADVANRLISETDTSKKVKLGEAFDTFFGEDNCTWSVEKTNDGVDVICITKCTFDGEENAEAVYKVSYGFENEPQTESFMAGSATLNQDQTSYVLKKLARFSTNPDYTTRELSSSKYNNMNYYYPDAYGRTLAQAAQLGYGVTVEEFLKMTLLPADMEGSTDYSLMSNYLTIAGVAALNNITTDEIKAQNELDPSTPDDKTLGEITDEATIELVLGLTEEQLSEFCDFYNLGEGITLNTKYGEIKDKITKALFDAEQQAREEAEALSAATPAPTASATVTEAAAAQE